MSEALHEIADELLQIEELLAASGGELTDEIEQQLDTLEGKFYDKVLRIGRYILELDAMATIAKSEKQRLAELSRVRDNKVKSMKRYLKMMLERTGRDRVETPTFKVSIVGNSQPSITWDGEAEEIPEAFRVTEFKLDRKAAREYYGEHDKLPDGFSVVRGDHLRIK